VAGGRCGRDGERGMVNRVGARKGRERKGRSRLRREAMRRRVDRGGFNEPI